MGVEPMEICVPAGEVKDRINIRDAYEVIRFDGGYIFATNGYRIIVKPYRVIGDEVVANSLYYAMESLFTLKDMDKSVKDKNLDNFEFLLKDSIPLLCTRACTCFDDINELMELTTQELERLERKMNKAQENLAKEDKKKNEEFKADVELGETLKNGF